MPSPRKHLDELPGRTSSFREKMLTFPGNAFIFFRGYRSTPRRQPGKRPCTCRPGRVRNGGIPGYYQNYQNYHLFLYHEWPFLMYIFPSFSRYKSCFASLSILSPVATETPFSTHTLRKSARVKRVGILPSTTRYLK